MQSLIFEIKSSRHKRFKILECRLIKTEDSVQLLRYWGYKESSWDFVEKIWPNINSIINLSKDEKEKIRVNSFYHRYVKRQNKEIESLKKDTNLILDENIDLEGCAGLSNEAKESLKDKRPKSIGEAARLPGMTPAASNLLLRYLKKTV